MWLILLLFFSLSVHRISYSFHWGTIQCTRKLQIRHICGAGGGTLREGAACQFHLATPHAQAIGNNNNNNYARTTTNDDVRIHEYIRELMRYRAAKLLSTC
jgi:hypothetical protein